jgi:hypothetical protein
MAGAGIRPPLKQPPVTKPSSFLGHCMFPSAVHALDGLKRQLKYISFAFLLFSNLKVLR